MLFRRSSPGIPPVLEKLDRNVGSNTVAAYDVALELAPHLRAVTLGKGSDAHFKGHIRGLAKSTITLPVKATAYKTPAENGMSSRWASFEHFYEQHNIPLTPGAMADITVLHELGHADRFAGRITAEYGNSKVAYREFTENYRQHYSTLPMKLGVAEAQMRGLIEKPADMWAKNHEAYAQLPEEFAADRFALNALAVLHGTNTRTTMAPPIAQPNVPRSHEEYARIMGLPPL